MDRGELKVKGVVSEVVELLATKGVDCRSEPRDVNRTEGSLSCTEMSTTITTTFCCIELVYHSFSRTD